MIRKIQREERRLGKKEWKKQVRIGDDKEKRERKEGKKRRKGRRK